MKFIILFSLLAGVAYGSSEEHGEFVYSKIAGSLKQYGGTGGGGGNGGLVPVPTPNPNNGGLVPIPSGVTANGPVTTAKLFTSVVPVPQTLGTNVKDSKGITSTVSPAGMNIYNKLIQKVVTGNVVSLVTTTPSGQKAVLTNGKVIFL